MPFSASISLISSSKEATVGGPSAGIEGEELEAGMAGGIEGGRALLAGIPAADAVELNRKDANASQLTEHRESFSLLEELITLEDGDERDARYLPTCVNSDNCDPSR